MTCDLHVILGHFDHKNEVYVHKKDVCLKKLDYMFIFC